MKKLPIVPKFWNFHSRKLPDSMNIRSLTKTATFRPIRPILNFNLHIWDPLYPIPGRVLSKLKWKLKLNCFKVQVRASSYKETYLVKFNFFSVLVVRGPSSSEAVAQVLVTLCNPGIIYVFNFWHLLPMKKLNCWVVTILKLVKLEF